MCVCTYVGYTLVVAECYPTYVRRGCLGTASFHNFTDRLSELKGVHLAPTRPNYH